MVEIYLLLSCLRKDAEFMVQWHFLTCNTVLWTAAESNGRVTWAWSLARWFQGKLHLWYSKLSAYVATSSKTNSLMFSLTIWTISVSHTSVLNGGEAGMGECCLRFHFSYQQCGVVGEESSLFLRSWRCGFCGVNQNHNSCSSACM